MERYGKVHCGFVAAITTWRMCTERGRAQLVELRAWEKTMGRLNHEANGDDILYQRELERLPPPPSAEPVDDGTIFYQSYSEARKQFEEALDALCKEYPQTSKKREMERALEEAEVI